MTSVMRTPRSPTSCLTSAHVSHGWTTTAVQLCIRPFSDVVHVGDMASVLSTLAGCRGADWKTYGTKARVCVCVCVSELFLVCLFAVDLVVAGTAARNMVVSCISHFLACVVLGVFLREAKLHK